MRLPLHAREPVWSAALASASDMPPPLFVKIAVTFTLSFISNNAALGWPGTHAAHTAIDRRLIGAINQNVAIVLET